MKKSVSTSMKQIMDEKKFAYTLQDVPPNFKSLAGGSYSDDDIELSIEVIQDKESNEGIKFSITINRYPVMNPFWLILYVQIQNQESKFFINNDKKGKRIQKSFISPFNSNIFTKNTEINYKIVQIPSYVCQLENDGCVCYMNCALQLFFHLSKFRSLIINTLINNRNNWLNNLINIFETMCTCKSNISTKNLTESFGWPSSARRIPHDASEFMEIMINNIKSNSELDAKRREKIDEIFASKIKSKDQSINQENEIEDRYIINLPVMTGDKTFMDVFEEEMKDTPFVCFPEVLFVTVNKLNCEKLPKELDLSKLGEKGLKHSKYTLTGIILRIRKQFGISHFTSFIRASIEDLWLYFSDTVQITYPWKYTKDNKQFANPLDFEIQSKLKTGQIHLLMYIADDVFNDYFTYTAVIPRTRDSNEKKEEYDGPTRKITITKTDDIQKYVQSGHTDFEDVGTSLEFVLSAELPYSEIYKRVSEELNVPIGSFVLRTESKTRSPSFHEFPKKPSPLKNIRRYEIHLYFEEVTEKRQFLCQYIPFYFLLFKFKPNSYIKNITINLVRPSSNGLLKSIQPRRIHQKGIERHNSDYWREEKIIDKGTDQKNNDKNSFQYITNLVLSTSSKFEQVLDKLLEIINQQDDQKKHTKIELFTAEYGKDGKEKIGYKRINVNKTIKEVLPQILYGTYIYVQCEDDFLEPDPNPALEQKIQPKFLFYKYMNQALKNVNIFPKQISNVFMMENFSIPVTFCKLTDPVRKSKTMLFPIKINLKNIEELKKIICAAMNETYPENGLMQLFFGFRSEKWPPFHDQILGEKDINSVIFILNFSLKNSNIVPRQINLSAGPSSSIHNLNDDDDDDEEEEKEKEVQTDRDYLSNVFIHYHIFDTFVNKKEISVRVYFSQDSITVDFISQVKANFETKVADIAKELRNIFSTQLSKEDKDLLEKCENDEAEFMKYYRILQTANGKISRELMFKFTLNSSMEVRFERIKEKFKKDELAFYIPVFYGARYNPQADTNYNTKYVGSVGTPFYFPVLKSDFDDENLKVLNKFKKSKLFKRLRSMITEKEICYDLFVVNYFGMIQDVKPNELQTIADKRLNYSICIKNLNASTFIDEVKFFNDGIRILR